MLSEADKERLRQFGPQLFGPVARRLISSDKWTDQYPAGRVFARELDALLYFADEQGCRLRFLPRLESMDTQRDEALSELRVAYMLHHYGFSVKQWDPPGLGGKVGEYLVGTPEGLSVFVEVKSPGWESELSGAEKSAGRDKQPKYIGLEGRAVGNWKPLQYCIESKAYNKFSPTQPNLLVVADDLKTPLSDSLDHVEIALYEDHARYGVSGLFTSAQFENLGGVGVFNFYSEGRGVQYEFTLFENPFALATTKLPDSFSKFKTKTIGVVRATVFDTIY